MRQRFAVLQWPQSRLTKFAFYRDFWLWRRTGLVSTYPFFSNDLVQINESLLTRRQIEQGRTDGDDDNQDSQHKRNRRHGHCGKDQHQSDSLQGDEDGDHLYRCHAFLQGATTNGVQHLHRTTIKFPIKCARDGCACAV